MITPGLRLSMTISVYIKKNPVTDAEGRRGEPEIYITTNCSPLDAVDSELVERLRLESPLLTKQAFVYVPKIQEIRTGMYLTYEGKDYPIRGLAAYPDGDFVLYQLVVEYIQVK